jgi:hypothetical protein
MSMHQVDASVCLRLERVSTECLLTISPHILAKANRERAQNGTNGDHLIRALELRVGLQGLGQLEVLTLSRVGWSRPHDPVAWADKPTNGLFKAIESVRSMGVDLISFRQKSPV